jgi:hypothetical protein
MKPSRIRTGLLTLVTTALLSLGGTARAQLEEFVKLLPDDPSVYLSLYQKFQSGNIHKITVRGTIDTTPTIGDSGIGPVFGISGATVPMVAYLFIDVSKTGPVEFLAEGTLVDGNTLLSDLVGYKENQILGVYLVLGGPTGPKKEVGFLNASGLIPRLGTSNLNDRQAGVTGPLAKVFLDDYVDTGEPEECEFSLTGADNLFQMGTFSGGPFFSDNIFVSEFSGGNGNYAFGTITSVDTVNTSEALNRVLNNKDIADRLFQQAKTKLASLKAKAKKKGVKPGKYGPYKKAQKKYNSALAAAKSLGLNPVE